MQLRFRGWLCVVALTGVALGIVGGCGPRAPRESGGTPSATANTTPLATPSDSQRQKMVALEIDYGNGRKQLAAVPWREGMTALDVLAAVQAGATPTKVERRGEGATAFVEAIDGVHNGGGSKSDRNWLYKVNGRLSPAGAGTVVVDAGDRVLWQYAAWE